jgi:hypothetical protein
MPREDMSCICRCSLHRAKKARPATIEENRDEYLIKLKEEIVKHDLQAVAKRVGGRFSDGKLTLKVLGKDFSVDTKGKISADIHINPGFGKLGFVQRVAKRKGNVSAFSEAMRRAHKAGGRYLYGPF